MKISYNWLNQYIDHDLSYDEIENKLTLLGLEVEETDKIGSDFENFVVGHVLDVSSHPNADRLFLCKVDLAESTVQIVCGAENVAPGQKVPVAKVGATLPVLMENGSAFTIKKAKLRGETSEGMICAEDELGLSEDHSGIMVLDSSLEPGTPLKEALKLENDIVYEIGLTPNRPDAACHIGVARDLSAVLKKRLKHPYKEVEKSSNDLSSKIGITIENPELCPRYVGMMVENVTVKESPQWLKNKLTAIGLRPINNVVDATNYVLHEVGQPLHAFDYDHISGKQIVVKNYNEEITFTTLDDVERKVPAGSLFICDADGPVAIAGVMGGENSEVTAGTTKVLIESAYFNPTSIRKTAKALALQTDSSYRFERGIDPNLQLKAAKRAADLIAELSGGTVLDNFTDNHPIKTEPETVELRVSRVNHLLGTVLKKKEISSILDSLEITVTEKNEDTLSCKIPTFRPDITREVDLIEEVGRVFDYNNIPTPVSSPLITPVPLSDTENFQQRLKSLAKSLGYKEIATNSLLSRKEANALADEDLQIHTLNPVSSENTILRTHLAGGFLKALSYNLNRNAPNLRFFEMGHTFRKGKPGTWIEGVEEHTSLLLGISGTKYETNWRYDETFYSVFDLKSDLEAIFTDLGIDSDIERHADGTQRLIYKLGNRNIARLSRIDEKLMKTFDIDQEAFVAEIDITELIKLGFGKQDVSYTPIPKFPPFEFDAAFIVDKTVRSGGMTDQIKKTAGNKLQSVSVFDVYEGENLGNDKKSIAFRLTFLDSNKTLNIKDVEPMVQKIVQSLEKTFGAKLRS
ncbi:MAG: phenylalanine--tRNA ligase subunit beta [Balneolaceae bacterium]